MGISKLTSMKSKSASKAVKAKITSTSGTVKHEFRVLSAEDVNNNRAKAYSYIVF